MFPDHAFHLKYSEPGVGFAGVLVVEGEDITERSDEI
jgi:hypothetical protein